MQPKGLEEIKEIKEMISKMLLLSHKAKEKDHSEGIGASPQTKMKRHLVIFTVIGPQVSRPMTTAILSYDHKQERASSSRGCKAREDTRKRLGTKSKNLIKVSSILIIVLLLTKIRQSFFTRPTIPRASKQSPSNVDSRSSS